MTQTVQPDLLSVPAANPNLIINGDMRIAQRGTSIAAPANGNYTLDRWVYGIVGAGVVTVSRDTDTPNSETPFSLKIDVTTADATLAATDLYFISQKLEGFNTAALALGTASAKTITVSFDVKSTKTGTFCFGLGNSAQNRSYRKEYTVSTTDTWESKTITISLDTAGTWIGATNGIGLTAFWTLAAGANYQGTDDTWDAGVVVVGTASQANALDNIANNFLLANVKLEVGSTATAFVPDDYATALAKCQRYYQLFGFGMPASCDLTTNVSIPFHTSVPMRTTSPTFVIENTSFQIRSNNAVRTASSPAVVGATAGDGSGFWKQINGLSSLTGGHAGLVYTVNAFSADAEL
jgi:hypothetical protein